ncbi:MAG: CHASE2 domain-containing protein, partial [Microcystaceae cyanobacterium]
MKSNKIRGWRGLIFFLSLTAAALTSCRYLELKWWQQAELSAFDQFVQKQAPQAPDPRIILVGITEGDLTSLKSSILDDLTVAELLRRIRQQQPRAIGLDV